MVQLARGPRNGFSQMISGILNLGDTLSLVPSGRSLPIPHIVILLPSPALSVSLSVRLTQVLPTLPDFSQDQDAQSLSPVSKPSLCRDKRGCLPELGFDLHAAITVVTFCKPA